MATGTDIIARGLAAKAVSALNSKADLVDGKVPAEQLPSYIDDIVEVPDYDHLPMPGESGKIYVTLDTNKSYRWSGSTYVEIPALDQVYTKSETDALLEGKQDILTAGNRIEIDEENIISVLEKPYVSLERLRSYAYQVTFDALQPVDEALAPLIGGCSAFVSNGHLSRTFDWNYNKGISFKVICNGFTGMGMVQGLTENNLDDHLIGQLPYHLLDGKNDSGIMVSSHVLYNDWDWHGEGDIPVYQIPYIILSQIKTMQQFVADMPEILSNLKSVASLEELGYAMQFLVTDGTTTYVIEPPMSSSGSYVIIDATANPKLTNFRWVEDPIVDRADLQLHPTGVERWNMIPCELRELKFTDCYIHPTRLSEFIGLRGTTRDTPDSELLEIYEAAHEEYERRVRDGKTWQTVHAVVYGSGGMESLYFQENFAENFCPSITISEINASQVIYTKNTVVAQDVGGLKAGFILTGCTVENILERLVGAYVPPVFTNTVGSAEYVMINKRTGEAGGFYMGDTAKLSKVTISLEKGTDFAGVVGGTVYIGSNTVYTLSESDISILNSNSSLNLELSDAEHAIPANRTSYSIAYGVNLTYNKKTYDGNDNIVIVVTPLSIPEGVLTIEDEMIYNKVYYGAIPEGARVSGLTPDGEITYGDEELTKVLDGQNELGLVNITITDEETRGVIISDHELSDIRFMTLSDIANWSKEEIIASYVRPNESVYTKSYYIYYRTMAVGSFSYMLKQ